MTTAGHKTIKLLLADDNPLVRELIVKGLEPFCQVEVSTDGADALLKVVDTPPDVILCDYKMPGLDGRQLFEKLRARESTRHIPFLFMASRSDIEERLRPLVDGVEDFIPKPFLIKDLVRITKKVVDRLHSKNCRRKLHGRESFKAARRNEHDRPDAVAGDGAEIVPVDRAERRRARRTLFCERAMPRRENRQTRRR